MTYTIPNWKPTMIWINSRPMDDICVVPSGWAVSGGYTNVFTISDGTSVKEIDELVRLKDVFNIKFVFPIGFYHGMGEVYSYALGVLR